MRALPMQAAQAREALATKAQQEKKAAQAAARESQARILADRTALQQAVTDLQRQKKQLTAEVTQLNTTSEALLQEEGLVNAKLEKTDGMIRELVGQIRINAKDLDSLIQQDLQSRAPAGPSFLAAVADDEQFPGMQEIRGMSQALLDQITGSGEVTLRQGTILDRAGREVQAELLFIGPFTAAYRNQTEVGFLTHSPTGGKLYALSRLPRSGRQKQVSTYMDGTSEAVPVDISRGGALRQLVHQLRFTEQIRKGGPIVWPILAILVIGLLLVCERCVTLLRRRHGRLSLLERIHEAAAHDRWNEAETLLKGWQHKPLARVLLAGLQARHLEREDLENVLQEGILKEIPGLERFLSSLSMLAAIAPLLGLLGTVTGMINVFHIITLHGASDPRMMSGGISEALVTTMLGLTVAIPIMLFHTLLSRRVETQISTIEEKSVAFVNMVFKARNGARTATAADITDRNLD